MKQGLVSTLSYAVLLSFGAANLPLHAAMLPTERAAEQSAVTLNDERAEVVDFLQREHVAKALAEQGVSSADAIERVATLSDEEVRELNGKIKNLPAGGDIVGVLFTVFIILLVTDILGLTKVFPFTRSVR